MTKNTKQVTWVYCVKLNPYRSHSPEALPSFMNNSKIKQNIFNLQELTDSKAVDFEH